MTRRHWRQAEHNRALMEKILSDSPVKYKDWAITTAFYAAVHYVEACLAMKNVHSNSHYSRKIAMVDFFGYPHRINRMYLMLETACRLARYLDDTDTAAGEWITEEELGNYTKTILPSIRAIAEEKVPDKLRTA